MSIRHLLTILMLCVTTACMAQYDYTFHASSYVFRAAGQSKADTIKKPATVYVDRTGTVSFSLTGKGTYNFHFTDAKREDGESYLLLFLFIPYYYDYVKLTNGDDQVNIDSDNSVTLSASNLPYISMNSTDVSSVYSDLAKLVDEGTFKTKPRPQQAAATTSSSGSSMICIYDGGYFIRDGQKWYEYRPKDRPDGPWAEYSQYGEETSFYNISSSISTVSVPKAASNNVFIVRNGKWEVVYYTKQVFGFCPQRGNRLFCHTRGFFFKDGTRWTEYLPDKNSSSAWATYDETSIDDNFYYLKNNLCEVAVPRKTVNKFFVKLNGKTEWSETYTTTQLFDY